MHITDTYKAAALAKKYSQAKAVLQMLGNVVPASADPLNCTVPKEALDYIDGVAAAKALVPLMKTACDNMAAELIKLGVEF